MKKIEIKRIIIFGDSITWGAGDNQFGGWVNRLKIFGLKNKRERESLSVYNCGISNDTSKELKQRIFCEINTKRFKIKSKIFIAIGINDARYLDNNKTPETEKKEFQENIKEIILQVNKFDIDEIVFLGLSDVDEKLTLPWDNRSLYWNNKRIQEFDKIIEKVAKENDCQYISLRGLLQENDLADGLHPNAQGHQKIFERVKKFLKL